VVLPGAALLRLALAAGAGTLGLFSLLAGLADRTRRALTLYAALAAGVSFHLALPLVRAPSAGGRTHALDRADAALSYLIPASALVILVALVRSRRRRVRNTALLFFGFGSLLLASLADLALARQAIVLGSDVPALGVGFLVFSAVLLLVVTDEERRLLVRATTDPLTGLANRAAFLERARLEVLRAERTGRPLAVVLLDLDHFKAVNDRYGHPAGDKVLVGAARAIAQTVRGIDLAARWGGEEFAVLLVEADESTAGGAVERIREAVGGAEPPRVPAKVTVSAGIAIHHGLFERGTVEGLLRRADEALYEAKRTGRNRAEFEKALAFPPSSPADVKLR
jgi:diguanylate cyclase (GGDEF)-like protein